MAIGTGGYQYRGCGLIGIGTQYLSTWSGLHSQLASHAHVGDWPCNSCRARVASYEVVCPEPEPHPTSYKNQTRSEMNCDVRNTAHAPAANAGGTSRSCQRAAPAHHGPEERPGGLPLQDHEATPRAAGPCSTAATAKRADRAAPRPRRPRQYSAAADRQQPAGRRGAPATGHPPTAATDANRQQPVHAVAG